MNKYLVLDKKLIFVYNASGKVTSLNKQQFNTEGHMGFGIIGITPDLKLRNTLVKALTWPAASSQPRRATVNRRNEYTLLRRSVNS